MLSCACRVIFFFNDPATTEIYTYGHTLSLHDALPIYSAAVVAAGVDSATAVSRVPMEAITEKEISRVIPLAPSVPIEPTTRVTSAAGSSQSAAIQASAPA